MESLSRHRVCVCVCVCVELCFGVLCVCSIMVCVWGVGGVPVDFLPWPLIKESVHVQTTTA